MAFGVFTIGVAPYQVTNNGQKPVRLHSFSSTDSATSIFTAGYLNSRVSIQILNELNVGDFIQATSTNGSLVCYISSIATNGVITLAGTEASVVLDGDTGSATGETINIVGGGVTGAGQTVKFSGSGNTLSLNLTDANANTILGKFSGSSTSTGTDNTTLGEGCLGFLTTGSRNTAVGNFAADNVSSASDNVALGNEALGADSIGSNNTAVGSSALLACTASGNTAVGTGAGLNLVGGTSNILIGFHAGSNYSGSENSNIAIQSPGVLSESNVTRIGFSDGSSSQSAAYIDGITNSSSSNSTTVVVDSNGRLYGQAAASNVTQLTSINTTVTLNTTTGIILTASTTLAAAHVTTFTLNNSLITSASCLNFFLMGYNGGALFTNGIPYVYALNPTTGSCTVSVANTHATNALNGTLNIGFQLL